MPTHGALSKAGKIRDQSGPIAWRKKKLSRKGRPFKGKKRKGPRIRNRNKYKNRILLGRAIKAIPQKPTK